MSKLLQDTIPQTFFDKVAELRARNIITPKWPNCPTASTFKNCQTLSTKIKTLTTSDMVVIRSELQKVNVSMFLSEFVKNIFQRSFSDLNVALNYAELCCILSGYYQKPFLDILCAQLTESYKGNIENFWYFVFLCILFLVHFPYNEGVFQSQFKDGLFFYLQTNSKEKVDLNTNIRLDNVVYLMQLLASSLTTLTGNLPSPNLEESLNKLDVADAAVKDAIVTVTKRREVFTEVFNHYSKTRATPYLSLKRTFEVENLVKTLTQYLGLSTKSMFVENTAKATSEPQDHTQLYDDQQTMEFYTSTTVFVEVMKVPAPLKATENLKLSFKRHVQSLVKTMNETNVYDFAKEFLKYFRGFVKIESYITPLVQKIRGQSELPLIAKYLYLIGLNLGEVNTFSVTVLREFESTTVFQTKSILIVLLSEFFKFTLEKKFVLRAFDYLLGKKSNLNIAKRLKLIYTALDYCCRHYVMYVNYTEQMNLKKQMKELAEKAKRKEKNDTVRWMSRIEGYITSENLTKEEIVYTSDQEMYLRYIIGKKEMSVEEKIVMLRKFDYEDDETVPMVVKYLFESLTNGVFTDIKEVVRMVIEVSKYHLKVLISFVDQLIEVTTFGFQNLNILTKAHRLTYISAIAELYMRNGIPDELMFKMIELVYQLTKYYEENQTIRKYGVSPYSSGFFGVRLLIEMLRVSVEKLFGKRPVVVVKTVLNIQVLMNRNPYCIDLECTFKPILKMLQIPRFNTAIQMKHFNQLRNTIFKGKYSLEQIRALIATAEERTKYEVDERNGKNIDLLKEKEEAHRKRLEELQKLREEEEKLEEEKMERLKREVNLEEFEKEIGEEINEMETLVEGKVVAKETEASLAMDPRNLKIQESDCGDIFVMKKTDGSVLVIKPEEKKKDNEQPKKQPKKKKEKIII
ncbi:hypothetical protein EIN_341800 [Entamoeba invadens IP1]|uniref:Uncharacterized protein n=1 Tax=Entamoeba invadens IP1 TaxID=370355 RepID=A0A0A1UE58_ENTIV|nr:hypothetical protein EIN_341800 [Entamoeba invadens IP1]ELP94772.1 hypothetical protein EIN_341800 [Entamoeba invadens IP1]|eukprot:XP_004261543.1 hypothetical protein EIN_341800 [Entamoeba invadens IP1]